MYLPVPTWLLFLFLTVAAFGPVVGRWPRWWLVYYAGLLVCWVLVSIAALRRAAQNDREAQQEIAHRLRRLTDAEKAQPADNPAATDA